MPPIRDHDMAYEEVEEDGEPLQCLRVRSQLIDDQITGIYRRDASSRG